MGCPEMSLCLLSAGGRHRFSLAVVLLRPNLPQVGQCWQQSLQRAWGRTSVCFLLLPAAACSQPCRRRAVVGDAVRGKRAAIGSLWQEGMPARLLSSLSCRASGCLFKRLFRQPTILVLYWSGPLGRTAFRLSMHGQWSASRLQPVLFSTFIPGDKL